MGPSIVILNWDYIMGPSIVILNWEYIMGPSIVCLKICYLESHRWPIVCGFLQLRAALG